MITKIRNYFKSISVEMNKVSWMTRDQVVNSTIIVGIFSFIIAAFLVPAKIKKYIIILHYSR